MSVLSTVQDFVAHLPYVIRKLESDLDTGNIVGLNVLKRIVSAAEHCTFPTAVRELGNGLIEAASIRTGKIAKYLKDTGATIFLQDLVLRGHDFLMALEAAATTADYDNMQQLLQEGLIALQSPSVSLSFEAFDLFIRGLHRSDREALRTGNVLRQLLKTLVKNRKWYVTALVLNGEAPETWLELLAETPVSGVAAEKPGRAMKKLMKEVDSMTPLGVSFELFRQTLDAYRGFCGSTFDSLHATLDPQDAESLKLAFPNSRQVTENSVLIYYKDADRFFDQAVGLDLEETGTPDPYLLLLRKALYSRAKTCQARLLQQTSKQAAVDKAVAALEKYPFWHTLEGVITLSAQLNQHIFLVDAFRKSIPLEFRTTQMAQERCWAPADMNAASWLTALVRCVSVTPGDIPLLNMLHSHAHFYSNTEEILLAWSLLAKNKRLPVDTLFRQENLLAALSSLPIEQRFSASSTIFRTHLSPFHIPLHLPQDPNELGRLYNPSLAPWLVCCPPFTMVVLAANVLGEIDLQQKELDLILECVAGLSRTVEKIESTCSALCATAALLYPPKTIMHQFFSAASKYLNIITTLNDDPGRELTKVFEELLASNSAAMVRTLLGRLKATLHIPEAPKERESLSTALNLIMSLPKIDRSPLEPFAEEITLSNTRLTRSCALVYFSSLSDRHQRFYADQLGDDKLAAFLQSPTKESAFSVIPRILPVVRRILIEIIPGLTRDEIAEIAPAAYQRFWHETATAQETALALCIDAGIPGASTRLAKLGSQTLFLDIGTLVSKRQRGVPWAKLSAALRAAGRREWMVAKNALQDVIDHAPRDCTALFYLGVISFATEMHESALKYLEEIDCFDQQVLPCAPTQKDVLILQTQCFIQLRRWQDAINSILNLFDPLDDGVFSLGNVSPFDVEFCLLATALQGHFTDLFSKPAPIALRLEACNFLPALLNIDNAPPSVVERLLWLLVTVLPISDPTGALADCLEEPMTNLADLAYEIIQNPQSSNLLCRARIAHLCSLTIVLSARSFYWEDSSVELWGDEPTIYVFGPLNFMLGNDDLQDDFTQARILAVAAVTLNPKRSSYWAWLAHFQQTKINAVRHIFKAMELLPDEARGVKARLLCQLAMMYIATMKLKEAAAACREAALLDPLTPDLQSTQMTILLYSRLAHRDSAPAIVSTCIREFNRAKALAPNTAMSNLISGLFELVFSDNRIDVPTATKICASLEAADGLLPQQLYLFLPIAFTALIAGRFSTAAKYFNMLEQVLPTIRSPYNILSTISRMLSATQTSNRDGFYESLESDTTRVSLLNHASWLRGFIGLFRFVEEGTPFEGDVIPSKLRDTLIALQLGKLAPPLHPGFEERLDRVAETVLGEHATDALHAFLGGVVTEAPRTKLKKLPTPVLAMLQGEAALRTVSMIDLESIQSVEEQLLDKYATLFQAGSEEMDSEIFDEILEMDPLNLRSECVTPESLANKGIKLAQAHFQRAVFLMPDAQLPWLALAASFDASENPESSIHIADCVGNARKCSGADPIRMDPSLLWMYRPCVTGVPDVDKLGKAVSKGLKRFRKSLTG